MVLPMENTEKMIFPGVGKYGIPEIKPETDIRIDRLEWIPVNYAMTATDKKSKGVILPMENTPQLHKALEAWAALGWRCKIVEKKALTTHDR